MHTAVQLSVSRTYCKAVSAICAVVVHEFGPVFCISVFFVKGIMKSTLPVQLTANHRLLNSHFTWGFAEYDHGQKKETAAIKAICVNLQFLQSSYPIQIWPTTSWIFCAKKKVQPSTTILCQLASYRHSVCPVQKLQILLVTT